MEAVFFSADGAVHSLRVMDDPPGATLDGRPLLLPPPEWVLLRQLTQCAGQPVSRKALLRALWGGGSAYVTRIVDVYVYRLRKRCPLLPIETAYQVGYQLNALLMGEPRQK